MDEPRVVRGVEGRGDLRDERDRPPAGERSVLGEERTEVPALDQAHVEEQPAVDLAVVVDRDDVRLPEPRDELGLGPEPGLELLVRGEPGRQPLHRHQSLVDGVVRAVHLAHAAPADQLLEAVGAEPLLRHGRSSPSRPS